MSSSAVVLDASALLAVALQEPGAAFVDDLVPSSFMSVVNLAEVGDRLMASGVAAEAISAALSDLGVTVVEPDFEDAADVARMFLPTRSAGLSLGDRFCLALAKRMNLPAVTGDRRWLDVAEDIGVRVELYR